MCVSFCSLTFDVAADDAGAATDADFVVCVANVAIVEDKDGRVVVLTGSLV